MSCSLRGPNKYYYAWGDGSSGQLCDGLTSSYGTPQYVDLSSSGVEQSLTEVASGGTTGYLLDSSGSVWSCGANNKGQLGNGTSVPLQPNPFAPYEAITAAPGVKATSVSSTQWRTSVVLTSTG